MQNTKFEYLRHKLVLQTIQRNTMSNSKMNHTILKMLHNSQHHLICRPVKQQWYLTRTGTLFTMLAT